MKKSKNNLFLRKQEVNFFWGEWKIASRDLLAHLTVCATGSKPIFGTTKTHKEGPVLASHTKKKKESWFSGWLVMSTQSLVVTHYSVRPSESFRVIAAEASWNSRGVFIIVLLLLKVFSVFINI